MTDFKHTECPDDECGYYDPFFDDNCGGQNMENCLMEKTDDGASSPLQHGVSGEEYRHRMAEYQISAKRVLQQRVTLRQMSIPTYILKEDGTLEEKLSEEVKRIDDHLKMIAESLFKEIVINGKNH